MNHWLDSTVEAHNSHFGKSAHPVVWEVGSRDGRDGVELATRIFSGKKDDFWEAATVVCMEPNPMQADIIQAEYPQVEVLELAASNLPGHADFVVYEGDEGAVGSSSLRLDWKEADHPQHIISVLKFRLDQLITDEQIDVMKIDVEGHSMEVLEGLGDKLKNVHVYHIETEKWTDSNIKVKAFMMARGFRLVDEVEQYGGMPDQVWVKD